MARLNNTIITHESGLELSNKIIRVTEEVFGFKFYRFLKAIAQKDLMAQGLPELKHPP